MTRLHDWLPRLWRYIESVRETPYHPVTHNCALFVAGAVEAVRGENPATAHALRSEADVEAVLRRYGGLRGLATFYFGEPAPPLAARRGDVLIADGPNGDTLGVCAGDHGLFVFDDGLHPKKLKECLASWRV